MVKRIKITRLSDLRKGDIIILRHRIPVSGTFKEEDGTLRKYKVLAVYRDYALCESMNGYPHTESFLYIQLREKRAQIFEP